MTIDNFRFLLSLSLSFLDEPLGLVKHVFKLKNGAFFRLRFNWSELYVGGSLTETLPTLKFMKTEHGNDDVPGLELRCLCMEDPQEAKLRA